MENKIEEYKKILESYIVTDVNDKPFIGSKGITTIISNQTFDFCEWLNDNYSIDISDRIIQEYLRYDSN